MKNYEWDNQAASTQRLSTLKRNGRAGYLGPSQEEYINQVAKTRLLEDQLLAEKIKCETLERKSYEYINTIATLEYAIGDMKIMLQKADRQLERHIDSDRQIEAYSSNLRQVGQELSSLNEILEKKSKECQKLSQMNLKLKQQNGQLEGRLKVTQKNKQIQKNKLREILQSLGTEAQQSFTEELLRDMELIQEGINDLKENLGKTKSALEKHRKESSDSLMREKERIIALQYSLKLAEKRNQDLEKKKNMQSSFSLDKKVEEMIEEMLKKEEELNSKINELEIENQSLKEQLEFEKQSNSHFIELKQRDHEKEIREAKETIKQLIHEKTEISEKLQELSHIQEVEGSRMASEEVELSRKYRQFCEENKRLKVKISELESDKKMLEKQLNFRNSN